jgi:hypothetical protein
MQRLRQVEKFQGTTVRKMARARWPGSTGIQRCAKSFILLLYDILARHTTASRALRGFKDFDVTAFAHNFDDDA